MSAVLLMLVSKFVLILKAVIIVHVKKDLSLYQAVLLIVKVIV